MKVYLMMVVAITIFQVGCAVNNTQKISTLSKADGIAIVSVLEDKFNLYDNSSDKNKNVSISVASWKVNDFIESSLRTKLSDNYQAITDFELRGFVKVPKINSFSGVPQSITDQGVLSISKTHNANYLLLISPIKTRDMYLRTDQDLDGYGIYKSDEYNDGFGIYEKTMTITGHTIQYVQLAIDVFDLRSGKLVSTNRVASDTYQGDSEWLTSLRIPPSSYHSDGIYNENDIEILKNDHENMVEMLIKRSLVYFNFKWNP